MLDLVLAGAGVGGTGTGTGTGAWAWVLAVECMKVVPAEKAPCKMASASTKSNVAVVESPWMVGSKSSSRGLEGEVMWPSLTSLMWRAAMASLMTRPISWRYHSFGVGAV